MSLLYEPAAVSIADVAAALDLPEDAMLRRALAEGWHEALRPCGKPRDGYGFETGALPPGVLGKVLQWLSWGKKIPPRICERDPWGEPFRYDRDELWREYAALDPRQRRRGLVRAVAAATAEASWHDCGGEYGDAAALAAAASRVHADVLVRIEGITAARIEEWALDAPGVRRYHPDDWAAVLAPRQDESEDPSIPREMWEFFAVLLLCPDYRFDTAAAHGAICAQAKRFRRGRVPPLEDFERRARKEFTRDLLDSAWKGAENALRGFLDRRSEPADPGTAASWDLWTLDQRAEGLFRGGLVRNVQALIDGGGLSARAAVRAVAGLEDVPAGSLRRWHAACKGRDREDWAEALIPRHGGGPRRAEIPPQAWEFLKRDYLDSSAPPFALSYRRACEAAAANGWGDLPSIDTVRRRFRAEVSLLVTQLIREGSA